MSLKIYEWGTVGQGQVEYDDLEAVKQDLAEYVPHEPPSARKPITLIPVVLTGYLVEGTAFFVAVERDDEQRNDSQSEVDA